MHTLSLYIHFPWCEKKCPYCDFNSHQAGASIPETLYVRKLLADLDNDLHLIDSNTSLSSIFIGGGTPSLISGDGIKHLLDGVRQRLQFSPNIEITMEANPGSAEQQRFRAYQRAGVNRLSLGVQSFNNHMLQRLGRIHNASNALDAIAMAADAGIENINIDLMFGLPQQNMEQAMADLQQAFELAPQHISWYQLTLEPNTVFYKNPPPLPNHDQLAEIQRQGIDALQRHGFHQYEISAFAQSGKRSIHNQNYWQFGDYLGIGAGAHGKISQPSGSMLRSQKTRLPEHYLQSINFGKIEAIEKDLLGFEFMLNALRLKHGVMPDLWQQRTGLSLDYLQQLSRQAISKGLIELEPRIKTTALGWQFLDDTVATFLPD